MMRACVCAVMVLLWGCRKGEEEPEGCADPAGCDSPRPACLTNSDCAAHPAGPICDGRRHECRVCTAHSDCPSSLCRSDEATLLPAAVGACAPSAMVAIVDGARCSPGGDGSTASPYCEVQEAISAHAAYIAVRPQERSAPYKPIIISAGQVAIFGPARDAEPQAVLGGVTVSGAGTQALLADLAVQRPLDTAVSCLEGRLSLLRTIVAYSRDGISSQEGCRLTVDQSRLSNNDRAALRTGTTARHRVTNTLLVQNGRGFELADRLNQTDIMLDLGSNQSDNVFSFNTITGNEGFVSCRVGQLLRNSILAGARSPLRDQGCALQQVYVGDQETPRFDRQFALTRDSHCCVDNALPDGAVKVDFDGNARPQGAGYDMGCYELR